MPVDVAQLVTGALGGAIVSGIIGPLISQRHQRRDLRAEAFRALADVERTRWAGSEKATFRDFRDAVVKLRAAALVAGAHRDLVDRYVYLAQIARRASDTDYEESGDPEYGGSINSDVSQLVRSAADGLADHLWHPYRKPWRARAALKQSKHDEETAREEHADDHRVRWDPYPF